MSVVIHGYGVQLLFLSSGCILSILGRESGRLRSTDVCLVCILKEELSVECLLLSLETHRTRGRSSVCLLIFLYFLFFFGKLFEEYFKEFYFKMVPFEINKLYTKTALYRYDLFTKCSFYLPFVCKFLFFFFYSGR